MNSFRITREEAEDRMKRTLESIGCNAYAYGQVSITFPDGAKYVGELAINAYGLSHQRG